MMTTTAASTMSSRRRQQQRRAQLMPLLPLMLPQVLFRFLLILLLLAASPAFCSDPSSSSSSSLILRVRLPDGSMQRVSVPSDQVTLKDVVQSLLFSKDTTCWEESKDNDDKESMPMLQVNGKYIPISSPRDDHVDDDNDDKRNNAYTVRTIRDWGLRQGSILTIIPSAAERKKTLTSLPPPSFGTEQQKTGMNKDRWDPFPDLATDYPAALLRTKRRRARGASLSYADLAQLQASMHVVEAQPTGPITRVYMCATSAERFQINSSSSSGGAGSSNNRVGLLLGTVQRERTNPHRKARTSLSSTTEAEEYCQVVKVHAIWEPPTPNTATAQQQPYDATPLFNLYKQQQQQEQPDHQEARVLRVAQWLGLQPVGWIYSYNDNRMKQQATGNADDGAEDALPVWIHDVVTGAKLQIYNMQSSSLTFGGRVNGSRFVTLAMDAQTGATEAFQLSDVAVQMVAEDMLLLHNSGSDDDDKKKEGKDSEKTKKKNKDSASGGGGGGGRFGSTKHPILVDGKETQTLDSVLCLINTAMLSHQGSFAGTKAASAVKKSNGRLTTKTRKSLLKALDSKDYASLFGILSNFQVLLAIDEALLQEAVGNVKASEQLVTIVRKWARGQKQGTVLDAKLEKTLRAVLEH